MAATGSLDERFAGSWTGTRRVWLEPGVLASESAVDGVVHLAAGGRAVVHEYSWSFDGEPQQGVMLLGPTGEQLLGATGEGWKLSWVDSFHTAGSVMVLEGGPELTVLGHYGASDGPQWGWRTSFDLDGDRLTIASWNITPDGAEALADEIAYQRV